MYQAGPQIDSGGISLVPLSQNGDSDKGTLRQGFARQFWRNGAIYIFRVSSNGIGPKLLAEPILGYEMPWYQSVNIDTFQDLEIAELISAKFILNI